jgi:hypothetical protein
MAVQEADGVKLGHGKHISILIFPPPSAIMYPLLKHQLIGSTGTYAIITL